MRVRLNKRNDGISQNGKVRPATYSVDGIWCRWTSIIKVGSERRGQMSTGGEANDSNAIRLHPKFCSTRPYGAECALSVSQFNRVMVGGADSILQNKGSNSKRVEPVRNLPSFVVCGHKFVTAARGNYDRSAVPMNRRIVGECRLVAHCVAHRSGSTILPKWEFYWLSHHHREFRVFGQVGAFS